MLLSTSPSRSFENKYCALIGLVLLILIVTSAYFHKDLSISVSDIEDTRFQYYTNITIFNDRNESDQYQICAISRVKDSAYLVPQWLEYHITAGVDFFFIADDCSNDRGKTKFWIAFYVYFGYVQGFHYQNCSNHVPDENRVFSNIFLFAKRKCKWIIVFDVDEYITPTTAFITKNQSSLPRGIHGMNCSFNIKDVMFGMESSPVYRLPWYLMSTHGLKHRPSGLIVDSYTYGQFNPHIKTLIQSNLVVEWGFSHHPRQLVQPIGNIIIGNESLYLDHYVRDPFVHKADMIVLRKKDNISSTDCQIPTGPLYLRHFNLLAWDDFVSIRGSRRVNSDGKPNFWIQNSLELWNWGNMSETCDSPRISRCFIEKMSKKVRDTATARLLFGRSVGNLTERKSREELLDRVLREDLIKWQNGDKIVP